MGRPQKWIAAENAAWGMSSLRRYWQQCNRHDRQVAAQERADLKARDKRRRKCRCEAYPWPHRPGGGFCRCPDPPLERWQPKVEWKYRPYRKRYAGILRQIARANNLHPIRDRAAIQALMPQVLALAKELHQQHPKYKYRNMVITATGVRGYWTTAGPTM